MTAADWLNLHGLDPHSFYAYASYALALALIVIEVVLVLLRERAILGHLGWPKRDPRVNTAATWRQPPP